MEPVIAIAILASALLAIIKMSLDYKREKWKTLQGASHHDREIGVGELHTLIRRAVEEANAPLETRMEKLEKTLAAPAEHPRLPAHPEE